MSTATEAAARGDRETPRPRDGTWPPPRVRLPRSVQTARFVGRPIAFLERSRRLGGDRRHHQLHQHLEPVGDGGRRPAGQEGGRARASTQAVGQDQPRAGLEGGHRVPAARPGSRPTSSSSASTWSATAAPPASATAARCRPAISQGHRGARPGGRGGALRQPQLRGPDQLRRARQLPGLAAAGGGLRAGRPDRHRPAERAARHRQRRPAGLPARHLADASRRSRRPSCAAVRSEMFQRAVRRRLRRRRALERPRRARRATPTPGTRRRPTSSSRPTSTDMPAEPAPVAGRPRRPRAGACSATASPPTTSRRPARSRPTSPAGKYLIEHGVRAQGLQLLRRAARQPRGDGARHLRQRPLRNRMVPEIEGGFTVHLPDGEPLTIYDAADEVPGRGRADGRPRRQGVRHRLLARLGGQGAAPARACAP